MTQKQFIDELKPELMRRGWWGRAMMTDPATGEQKEVQLGSVRRLKTIYDTNLRTAYAAGHWARIEENKASAPYVMYSAILDGRTRPQHRAWNGKVLRIDDPWWQTHTPPNGWNCFPAGTTVRADAQIGLKTWYAGKMVQIETRRGHRLTVTANHPIVTARGRLRARVLEKGDQLLCDRGVIDAGLIGIVDDEQPPAEAEQLFESLNAQGFRIVPMAAHDFHGDALSRKPEIHVAGADRHLVDEIESEAQQLVGERQLGRADGSLVMHPDVAVCPAQRRAIVGDAVGTQYAADVARTTLESARDSAFGNKSAAIEREHAPFKMGVAIAGRGPGSSELASDAARIRFDGAPFDSFGVRPAAQFYPAQSELAAERLPTTPCLFRQLLEANPASIAADEVIEVRHFEWAGHVYDFQTRTGLIVAAGLVIYNCRCTVIQLSDRDLARLGKASPDEAPPSPTREWQNPRTGEVMQVPVGVDPGWGYAPGASRRDEIVQVARDKAAGAPPELRAAFLEWLDATIAQRRAARQ